MVEGQRRHGVLMPVQLEESAASLLKRIVPHLQGAGRQAGAGYGAHPVSGGEEAHRPRATAMHPLDPGPPGLSLPSTPHPPQEGLVVRSPGSDEVLLGGTPGHCVYAICTRHGGRVARPGMPLPAHTMSAPAQLAKQRENRRQTPPPAHLDAPRTCVWSRPRTLQHPRLWSPPRRRWSRRCPLQQRAAQDARLQDNFAHNIHNVHACASGTLISIVKVMDLLGIPHVALCDANELCFLWFPRHFIKQIFMCNMVMVYYLWSANGMTVEVRGMRRKTRQQSMRNLPPSMSASLLQSLRRGHLF